MTSQAFSFTSGTWATSHSLHPVVDDNYGSSGSGGVYRWDIQNSTSTEHVGSGYILQYDGSQSEPWSVSSSVWSGGATISRPSTGVIRVTAQSIDRGTWTETAAFLNGVMPSSGGGTGTEGFSYSGTLTVNGNDLEYDIPASSSSGSYYLLSGVNNTFSNELTISVGSNGASGSAPNFDQTKTWMLRSPTEDELARWTPPSTTKKVFCNFW